MNYNNIRERDFGKVQSMVFEKNWIIKIMLMLVNIIGLMLFYNIMINPGIVKTIISLILMMCVYVVNYVVNAYHVYESLKEMDLPTPKFTIRRAIEGVKESIKYVGANPIHIIVSALTSHTITPSMMTLYMMYDGIEMYEAGYMYVYRRKIDMRNSALISLFVVLFTVIIPIIITILMKGRPSTTWYLSLYAMMVGIVVALHQLLESFCTYMTFKDTDLEEERELAKRKKEEKRKAKERYEEVINKENEKEEEDFV